MKKQLLFVATLVTVGLSACSLGQKTAGAPETTMQESVKVQTDTANTSARTEEKILQETTKAAESDSNNQTLNAFLDDYPDSRAYHLLHDVALNPEANTKSDSGVTYMFSKDSGGNRVMGSVIAYYTNVENMETTTDNKAFCNSFIKAYFPELNLFFENAEIHDDAASFGEVVNLSDYSITLIPDKELKGMTVILSSVK